MVDMLHQDPEYKSVHEPLIVLYHTEHLYGGQKDALHRQANIKKSSNLIKQFEKESKKFACQN